MSKDAEQGPMEISQRRKKSLRRPRLMDSDSVNPDDLGPGTPAAIYLRVSSEEQVEGYSLDAQERACQEFLERRKWALYQIYKDPGHSGKNDKRPGFQEMFSAVEAGLVKVVIVHKLDRFSRNIDNTLRYFRELNKHDATIVSVTETFDYSTAQGRMFFHMMAVFAQWYLENLSAEVVKSKVEMARKGIHNGPLPFGYTKRDGEVVIVEEEAAAIRTIFELYSLGNHSDQQLSDHLTAQGFKTRRGRNWSKDTVRELLHNEFFYGRVAHRDELWPGRHEPLITRELFEKCQDVRQNRARRPKSFAARHVRTHLLQRIICCNACERPLRVQTITKYRKAGNRVEYGYYQEVSHMRGLSCEHAGKSVRMELADEWVLRLLASIRLPDDWQEEIERAIADADVVRQIESRRMQIEKELHRLARAFGDGAFTEHEYDQRRSNLHKEKESLVIPDTATVVDLGLQLDTLADFLDEATVEEKAKICQLIFDSVFYDFATEYIVRIKPKGDFAFLFRTLSAQIGWEELPDGSFSFVK